MTLRVHFFVSDKPRERILADAVLRGAQRHGFEVSSSSREPEQIEIGNYDVACFVGVKSRDLYRAHENAGVRLLMIDKGYLRGNALGVRKWEYWRIAVDSHHPTSRLMDEWPSDRWDRMNVELRPWREKGGPIIIAGSSGKYHEFHRLKDPTHYARDLVRDINRITTRDIVYRPKPSWRDAEPIKKARYSRSPESIYEVLTGAWVLVTHGSNACFEAMVMGVPSIVLGDGVARPISSTSLDDIESPRLATLGERQRLMRGLAYHQYTRNEFASGLAWETIRKELHE